jgi:DNA-binding beta-propeller fold protein YncE
VLTPRRAPATAHDPVAVAVDSSNGQVYVAGIRRKASGTIPTALVGYSSSGAELWSLQRDDGNETYGFPRLLATDPTAHHVFLGSDHSISTDHIASMTRAFTASGTAVWWALQSSPNASGDGGPASICVDSGTAQVYETDANDGHAQMFTVAYQTT